MTTRGLGSAAEGAAGAAPQARPERRVTGARPTLWRADAAKGLAGRDAEDMRLAVRAGDGDRDAAVLLYRRYLGEIYGYFWNQTSNAEDAEDLTSDTFLKVVRALPMFEGRSTFRTWLYEIARNQLKDFWRARARRPAGVPLELSDREGADIAAVDERTDEAAPDRHARIETLLAALPETYRQVLIFRILEGRSVKDTAVAMGKTENHVKVLTHRALKRAAEIGASPPGGTR